MNFPSDQLKYIGLLQSCGNLDEIIELARIIVESAENRIIDYDANTSGLATDEIWQNMHRGNADPRYVAHFYFPDDNRHVILFERKSFEKKLETMTPFNFQVHHLEMAIHEFLHVVGYRDESTVKEKADKIMWNYVGVRWRFYDSYEYNENSSIK